MPVETLSLLAKELMTQKELEKANKIYLKIAGFPDIILTAKGFQTEVCYRPDINR